MGSSQDPARNLALSEEACEGSARSVFKPLQDGLPAGDFSEAVHTVSTIGDMVQVPPHTLACGRQKPSSSSLRRGASLGIGAN